MRTARSGPRAIPSRNVYAEALRLLAMRRLTEAQLHARLLRRGFELPEIRSAVDRCRSDGFLDDRLFARLYVEGRSRAVGDARLVADLVRRGIERGAAAACVGEAERGEDERLAAAIERLFRTRPGIAYPSAARALERLAFPAHAIYRQLRSHAARFGPFALNEDAGSGEPDET